MSPQARGRTNRLSGGRLTAGEHLRAEMERLGFNQVSLGKALGVTRQTVSNVIHGRQPVSRAMSAGLGRLTNRPADYWLQSSFPGEPAASAQGLLVDHQIASAIERGRIGIAPFDKARLRAASIELTFGGVDVNSAGKRGSDSAFRLKKGRSATMRTRELVEFPNDHVGRVGVAPDFARAGLAALHGLQIEPGFSGALSITVFNAGNADVLLHPGDPVFAIEIVALSCPAST